jgi:hypothetical protein
MAINKTTTISNSDNVRYAVIALLAVLAFFGAYKFAQGRSVESVQAATVGTQAATAGSAQGDPAAAGGGGCCGGSGGASAGAAAGATGGAAAAGGAAAGGGCCGGSGAPAKQVSGTAAVSGGVQKIAVDVKLQYTPNVLKLKAGVPAEITFSAAQGCTSVVQSQQLGFSEDLSAGPKTVKLQGLAAGTYTFACGMNMVQGQIVVE